jgi:hypothetical protein
VVSLGDRKVLSDPSVFGIITDFHINIGSRRDNNRLKYGRGQ